MLCVSKGEGGRERRHSTDGHVCVYLCVGGGGNRARMEQPRKDHRRRLCVDIIIKSVAARIDRLLPEHPLGRYRQVYTK